MTKIPAAITDRTATLYLNGEAYSVDRSTPAFALITAELAKDDHDIDAIKAILNQYETSEIEVMESDNEGRIEVKRRGVYYDGRLVNSALASRMLDIQQAGLPLDPWIKFMANVYQNPADYAQDELYLWLEKSTLPITEDGHFLAYKKVRADFKDIYTGKMDNSPGTTVVMPGGRQVVDPNRHNTCSVGLHFCSKDYLPSFGAGPGNKVVLVKVNPADVVSIPSDYDNAKGRTWKYEVISEIDWSPADREFAPITNDDGTDWFRFDPEGYDENGFDKDGYDRDGYDEDGFDEDEYNREGFSRSGYDEWGYDEDGYDADGFDGSGYNEDGYDRDGFDVDGYDEDGYNPDVDDDDDDVDEDNTAYQAVAHERYMVVGGKQFLIR